MPHLPDMLFAQNKLLLERAGTAAEEPSIRLELNPFEALKRVNPTEDLVHVALAKEWIAARSATTRGCNGYEIDLVFEVDSFS